MAPIPLQHKYPIHPSNEADMQDALIAATLDAYFPATRGHRAGVWIALFLGGLAHYVYWVIIRMNCGIVRADLQHKGNVRSWVLIQDVPDDY